MEPANTASDVEEKNLFHKFLKSKYFHVTVFLVALVILASFITIWCAVRHLSEREFFLNLNRHLETYQNIYDLIGKVLVPIAIFIVGLIINKSVRKGEQARNAADKKQQEKNAKFQLIMQEEVAEKQINLQKRISDEQLANQERQARRTRDFQEEQLILQRRKNDADYEISKRQLDVLMDQASAMQEQAKNSYRQLEAMEEQAKNSYRQVIAMRDQADNYRRNN